MGDNAVLFCDGLFCCRTGSDIVSMDGAPIKVPQTERPHFSDVIFSRSLSMTVRNRV